MTLAVFGALAAFFMIALLVIMLLVVSEPDMERDR